MNHKQVLLVVFFVFALASAVSADVFMPMSTYIYGLNLTILLIPIVLIEAAIAYFFVGRFTDFKISFLSSVAIFLVGNFISSIAGAIVLMFVESSARLYQMPMLVFVLAYIASSLIELPFVYQLVKNKAQCPHATAIKISFIANAGSYILLAAVLIALPYNVTPIPHSQDPVQAAASALQSVVDKAGTMQETTPVIFLKDTAIASETLANGVGLDPSQVCLDRGEYGGEDNFTLLGGDSGYQILQWIGTNSRQAKIAVLCALSGSSLQTYIETYGDTLTPVDTDTCACLDDPGRCCLVQLRQA